MQNQRTITTIALENPQVFKENLLAFYEDQVYFTLLDSNDHVDHYSNQQWLAGAGSVQSLEVNEKDAFNKLRDFHKKQQDWLLGFLSYDLKNELEHLQSTKEDTVAAPLMHFFVPKVLFLYTPAGLEIQTHHGVSVNAKELVQEIMGFKKDALLTPKQVKKLVARDTKPAYVAKVKQFLSHIARGDMYEANFCTQFIAHDVALNSLKAYHDLNELSKSPFSVYARFADLEIMCASPERYLKKQGDLVTSQPIKGTAKRVLDSTKDNAIKAQLAADPKERSENVMIVDLVRNDLSKIAVKGSVTVTALFEIYSFKQVHQMISTITAQVQPKLDFIDVLKATFPMGSMTGAPKVSAMRIIEQKESFKRGLYSGAIGYITPQGNMDFNVVIRTILYNRKTHELSLSVGSAITINAIPESEYDECLLKARALLDVLALQGIAF